MIHRASTIRLVVQDFWTIHSISLYCTKTYRLAHVDTTHFLENIGDGLLGLPEGLPMFTTVFTYLPFGKLT